MQTSHSTVSLGSSVPTFVTGRAVTNAHDTIAITYRPEGGGLRGLAAARLSSATADAGPHCHPD